MIVSLDSSATILITRPYKKNDASEYTYQWGEDAVKIAKSMGYNVVDIKNEQTTYDNVSRLLSAYRPRLYAHFGHGCPTSLQGKYECIVTRKYGIEELVGMVEEDPSKCDMLCNILDPVRPHIFQNNSIYKNNSILQNDDIPPDIDICYPICTKDTNVQLLSGTITLSVACHSASQLGLCAISSGTETFIGFDDLLMFPIDLLGSQNMFKNVIITMFREILSGNTIDGANIEASKLEDQYIRDYKSIKYIALPMLWNKLHRRILGNRHNMIYR